MNHSNTIINSVILVSLLFFIGVYDAQAAYLDPGSGSFIVQLIIASLVGISFVVKMFWAKIKTFLANPFASGQNLTDEN